MQFNALLGLQTSLTAIALTILGHSPLSHAASVFSDGNAYTFSTATPQSIRVTNTTQMTIESGANIGADLFGGEVSFLLENNAVGIINDGTFQQDVDVENRSTLSVYGGNLLDDLYAYDNSSVFFYDGSVAEDIEMSESSFMQIYGGSFGEDIDVEDAAQLEIYGGAFNTAGPSALDEGGLVSSGRAIITLYGTDFFIDGNAVTSLGSITEFDGTLTGTLADGSAFDMPFERDRQRIGGRFGRFFRGQIILADASSIVLVPNPSAASIGLLSGVLIAARRRRRQ